MNGGAISLSNNVPLSFYEGCAVEFSKNAATGFGGALYNAGDKERVIQPTSKLNKCTIRLIKDCNSLYDCDFDTNMFSITFIDNHAQCQSLFSKRICTYVAVAILTCAMPQISFKERLPHILVGL